MAIQTMEGEGGGFKGGYRTVSTFPVPHPGIAEVAGDGDLGSGIERLVRPEPHLGNRAGQAVEKVAARCG